MQIGDYLISRLYDEGVRHIFGIPGDFVLSFYKKLEEGPIELINTCDEQGAGFAADAYARINGLGAVCITYCVGGLKVANTTAQAYAEKSPVIVISGSPGIRERRKDPLLHHKVKDFDTQLKVLAQLTVASTVIDDPQTAIDEIDRVIKAAKRHKRPVYIELPRDMVYEQAMSCKKRDDSSPVVDQEIDNEALKEAIAEAVAMINAAHKPAILADVEVHRFALQEALLKLVDKTNIPVATTILGKSLISELHPRFIGVYEGAMGKPDVIDYIETADCLIMLGVMLTDVNLGIFTAKLDQNITIKANYDSLYIKHHRYDDIPLETFMSQLIEADIHWCQCTQIPPKEPPTPFTPTPSTPITIKRLFEKLNTFLADNTIVIADVGDALFGATDLCIHSSTEFLSPAYYTSLGFAVPGAIGAQKARGDLRPLVIVGDGAFQMTGMELSTILRYQLNPIIIVLNNGGYGTERPIIDGSYNNILSWNYSKIPELLGGGYGYVVETEEELVHALNTAMVKTDAFNIIEVKLDPYDFSPALNRLSASLAKRLQKSDTQ